MTGVQTCALPIFPVRKIVDEQGIVIKKIYNPGVGKYDVRVTTGPSYLTKRQETMEVMSQILQGNPELWKIAGDLFVKSMDFPDAQEIAERLKRSIDPKILANEDDPALAAAQKQMEAMAQELDNLHKMLTNVSQSYEAKQLDNEHFRADIEAFKAETQRLTALSGSAAAAPVSPDIQEVVKAYIREILAQPNLEEEEPKSFEEGEMHSMEQPQMMPEQPQLPPGA